MNNLQKMNELVKNDATKEQIMNWAYTNRITVMTLPFEYAFESMSNSVDSFIEEYEYYSKTDEHKAWDIFLESEYVEQTKNN